MSTGAAIAVSLGAFLCGLTAGGLAAIGLLAVAGSRHPNRLDRLLREHGREAEATRKRGDGDRHDEEEGSDGS